jgi:nucleoside diphosphate kinase
MAVERSVSIIKPDATARSVTGAIKAMIENLRSPPRQCA